MAEVSLKKSTIYFNTIHKEKKAVNFSFLPKKAVAGNLGCLQFVMWSKVVFFAKSSRFVFFWPTLANKQTKEGTE